MELDMSPRGGRLSPSQRRLWFLQQLSAVGSSYNIAISIGLEGRLDESALNAALQDIVARHEELRCTYPRRNGQPVRCVASLRSSSFIFTEHCSTDDAVQDCVERYAREVFDLTQDIPFRAVLLTQSTSSHTLLIVIHHIAADGWSLPIIANDLSAAYNSRLLGREPDWTPSQITFEDYLAWQTELLGEPDDPGSLQSLQDAYE